MEQEKATGEPPYCIWNQPMRILIGRELSQPSNSISAAAADTHAAPAATEVHADNAADADAAGKGDITLQKKSCYSACTCYAM